MDNGAVLVVEDEPALAEVVVAYLRQAGFRATVVSNGERAVEAVAGLQPDLVVLDVNLPGIDGFEVARRVRAQGDVPIIFLTARVDDVDRVHGLRLGGDDYVTKPFHPPELVERVVAVLRRTRPRRVDAQRVGRLVIDHGATSCSVDDSVVDLTAAEFRLLAHLVAHPRQSFDRARLLASVFPDSEANDRVIDAHLGNVRRKLTAAGLRTVPVTTLRGIGYRFDPEKCE